MEVLMLVVALVLDLMRDGLSRGWLIIKSQFRVQLMRYSTGERLQDFGAIWLLTLLGLPGLLWSIFLVINHSDGTGDSYIFYFSLFTRLVSIQN